VAKDPTDTDKWRLFSNERHDEPRWSAKNPTGVFDSAAASFRLMPKSTSTFEAAATVIVLYGAFIGLPALAGLWALGRIAGWW
jgi:hypothetical protein